DTVSEHNDPEQYYKTQYEILKSRGLAARVIRDEGLETHALFARDGKRADAEKGFVASLWANVAGWAGEFGSEPRATKDKDPSRANPAVVSGYLSLLDIKPVSKTTLVRVGFVTPDPALSARLANAHAEGYVRHGMDLRSQTNEEGIKLLERKLLELKSRVEESEAALNAYRRDKGIISLDEKSGLVLDRLVDLNTRLTKAEADRIAVEAQLKVNGNSDVAEVVSNNSVALNLRAELARLEGEYAQYAKEFKPGYPRLEKLKSQIENVRRQLSNQTESAYVAAKTRETQLRDRLQQEKEAVLKLKDSGVQYVILAREVDANRQLYDSVLQRIKEMGVMADVRTPNVYVTDRAEPPSRPSYPNKRQVLLIALLIGLAAGVGLAFLLEQFNDTLHSPQEVERYVGLPSLALIPDFASLSNGASAYRQKLTGPAKFENLEGKLQREIVSSCDPFSIAAEAYRGLRASMLLSRAEEPPQTVLIASAARGEGKTITAINIAVVFAQLGARVVLLDADFRRPRCHRLLRMDNGYGMTQLLAGQIQTADAVRATAVNNLFFISSGEIPPNPAELLASRKMDETLESLREHYDFIFIDSSPVMAVSDAILLSNMVDGVILVADSQKTPKQFVREARSRLSSMHAKILGVLLNRVSAINGTYNYCYYDYCIHKREAEGDRPLYSQDPPDCDKAERDRRWV
ncbi:MAG TPA: polysaccharide biosynthesis tyrosine autokinase, partial [Candidatus Binatia bacterium]|nr:polysaccharide biosynthesis tyrosine autokinase [Candidatus Binatia bacterium]